MDRLPCRGRCEGSEPGCRWFGVRPAEADRLGRDGLPGSCRDDTDAREAVEAYAAAARDVGNASSLHAPGRRARRRVEESRERSPPRSAPGRPR